MMKTTLSLNIARLAIGDVTVQVGTLPYEGREQLARLRAEHQGTHVFRRDGQTLTAVAVAQGAAILGEKTESVRLQDAPYLCAVLTREALVNLCAGLGRPTSTYEPIRVPAAGDNLVKAAAERADCPSWLTVRLRYLAAIRVLRFGSEQPFAALVLDVDTTRGIDRSCADLAADRLDVAGLYVGQLRDQPDSRLAKHFKVVGRVHHVEGSYLLLVDTREGVNEIAANEAYLDPDAAAFERCLTHAFGERARDIKQALETILATERGGAKRLERLRGVVQRLSDRRLELLPGVPLQLEPFLSQGRKTQFPTVQAAPKTVYVFDPAGSRTSTWNDGGLNQHGPYTGQHFTPSRPRICVVCRNQHQGQVEQFLHKFREGIPAGRGRQGLLREGLRS